MNVAEDVAKYAREANLSYEEINFFVAGYMAGLIMLQEQHQKVGIAIGMTHRVMLTQTTALMNEISNGTEEDQGSQEETKEAAIQRMEPT